MAGEVIEQQLADPRRLLIGGVVPDDRQWRETVIRLDEFSRAFRGYSADRVIGLAPDEQGRHAGGADRRALAARAIPSERCFHGRRIADHRQVLFDGFAGNAVARQAVPHPLPVFGEQPLPGVRIEQFLVMARPVRLLEIPLRIAEEAATLDHVSKGRLIFGVGRSGVVKTYEALNIAYSESKDREIECLEIIQRAWQEDNFSYKGKFYDIQDVTVVRQPVQQPTPEIRIAAVSVETFPAAGNAGQGLFLSVRHEDVRMFKQHIDVYRKAWTDAGHPGEARPSISVVPVSSPKPIGRPRMPTGPR